MPEVNTGPNLLKVQLYTGEVMKFDDVRVAELARPVEALLSLRENSVEAPSLDLIGAASEAIVELEGMFERSEIAADADWVYAANRLTTIRTLWNL